MISNKSLLLLIFILSSIVYIIGSYRFLRNSYFAIKNRVLNMDVLIALSTSSAYFYSVYNFFNNIHTYYFETASIIIGIILLGKYIENLLKSKKLGSISNLLKYRPKKVLILKNNEITESDISDIKEGDIIELRKGDFVPVDSLIIEGSALVDFNFIYGEINKIELKVNDEIKAGTLIVDGNIKIKSFQNYEQSFWNSLEYLIKNISNKESSYLSLVDKISGNFVIIVFSLALISFGIWRFILNNDEMAFKSFISTLIIACPCAIELAYPLAVNKGIIESVKKNILVKDISVFEKIVKSNFFIFDKTGTITSNNLIIQKINYKKINIEQNKEDNKLENIDSLKDTNLLEDINTLVNEILFISTYKSNHILSKSIHNFIKNTNNLSLYKLLKNYKILDFKEIVSRGIYAKINYNNNFEYDIYLGNKDFIFESIKSFNDKIDIKRIKNEINTIKDENSLNAYFIIIKNNLVFVGVIEYQEEIISETIELINFLKTNNKEVYILTGASKKSSIFFSKKNRY
jgi:Cu+-exporting ATPase